MIRVYLTEGGKPKSPPYPKGYKAEHPGVGSGNYPRKEKLGSNEQLDFSPFDNEQFSTDFRNWRGGLSSWVHFCVSSYSSLGYQYINPYLRNGLQWEPVINNMIEKTKPHSVEDFKAMFNEDMTKERIAGMDGAFTYELPKDIVVFRAVSKNWKDNLKVGEVFGDKGYVSTSVDPKVARSFLYGIVSEKQKSIHRILIPKGTKLAFGMNPDEKELILPRNTKFKVLDAENVVVIQ